MSDVFVGQNGQKYKAVEHERKFLKFGADGEPVYRYPTTIYCEPFGPRRCKTCGTARAKVGRQCRQCAHPEPALERYKQEATHPTGRP